jgi:hypothetical protein
MTNWTQCKSHGELVYLGSIFTAVVLFVVVLPVHEAFSGRSSNSSVINSLETIEESEEEDVPSPMEEDDTIINESVHILDSLKFVEEGAIETE